jgi:hypothetical protein
MPIREMMKHFALLLATAAAITLTTGATAATDYEIAVKGSKTVPAVANDAGVVSIALVAQTDSNGGFEAKNMDQTLLEAKVFATATSKGLNPNTLCVDVKTEKAANDFHTTITLSFVDTTKAVKTKTWEGSLDSALKKPVHLKLSPFDVTVSLTKI